MHASARRSTGRSCAATRATLVEDAHTTSDLRPWGSLIAPEQAIAYTNVYWKWSAAPGRSGRTVATAEVDFAAR